MSSAVGTKSSVNPWLASIYGGIITAIPAVALALLIGAEQPYLGVVALLLTGVGPVLGYQLATGQLGSDWKSIIGGLIGGIPIIILWPILVGALTRGQSVGKLLLGSIVGAILGVAATLLILTVAGQDPANFGFAVVLGFAVWGGSAAAFMASGGN